jgi:tape measure domain-containing protein
MIAGALEIQMMADLSRIQRDMNGAVGIVGSATDRMGSAVDRLRTGFGNLAAAYVSVQLVREFVQTADAMAAMDGRLRNVIGSGQDYAEAQRELYAISMRNNVALQDSTALFTRIIEPVQKMGGGVREAATMVDALSTGLRISNATQAESSSAILQFSQAMAGGVLRGEEFNAVNEAAPQFLGALANALGVGRGELRKMAEDGKLTADVVGNAMPAALAELQAKAAGLPETVGGAMSDLRNEFSLAVAQIDRTTGATGGLAQVIGLVADLVREFNLVMGSAGDSAGAAGQSFDVVGFAIRGVGTVAEVVLVLISDVVFVLKSVGREAGGVAAQVAAAVRGDFAAVGRIRDEMIADGQRARAELDRYQTSVVNMTNRVLQSRDALRSNTVATSENVTEMARLARQGTSTWSTLRAQTTASAAATKAAAAEAKKAAAERARADAEEIKLAQQIANTRADLRRAEQRAIETHMAAEDARRIKEVAAARDAVAKAQQEYDQYGLTRSQIAELGLARLKDKQTAFTVGSENYDSVQLEIDAQRELIDLLQRTEFREAGVQAAKTAAEATAKAAADSATEWQRFSESIGQGLTDSLFRAFESGRGFFDTLWDGIKNTVKTTVLRVLLQPVQAGIGGLLGGMSGGAQAGTGGGLGNLWSQISPWLNDFGGSVETAVTSIANAMGSREMQAWLAQNSGTVAQYAQFAGDALGYLNALSKASDGQWGAAAGSAIGTYFGGPVGAMIGNAIGSAIDKLASGGAGTPHMGSVVRIGAGGATTLMGDDSQITRNFTQSADDALRVVGGASVDALNAVSRAFGGGSDFEAVLKFASDGRDPSIGDLAITRNGQTLVNWGQQTGDFKKYVADAEEAFRQFSGDVAAATVQALDAVNLPGWARDQVQALGSNATVEQVAALAVSLANTQQGLMAVQSSMAPLGGVLGRVAGLSGDALYQLTQFAGGVEAFARQAAGFVQGYFTQDEQAALQARSIFDQLQAAGLNAGSLGSRQDLRALIERDINVNTEAGRRQLAAVLAVAEAFAPLGDYLAEQGTTLGALAAQAAPTNALASLLTETSGQQQAGAEATVDSLMTVAGNVTAIGDQISQAVQNTAQPQLTATQAGFEAMREELNRLNEQVARMLGNSELQAAAP